MTLPVKIDLHMHTVLSDGTDTPREIISRVREAGIELFSVTDHDGIGACSEVPPLLGEGDPVFITGAEFSCRDDLGKYHILGYGFDPESPAILELVEEGHSNRFAKVRSRLELLKSEYGIAFPDDEIKKLLSLANPGKPHIGNLMVKYGYSESKDRAIREYLNKLHIRPMYIRPERAVDCILRAGGIPVLAHPSYGDGDQLIMGDEMEDRVRRLVGYGLEGLEAFYSGFTPKLTDEILSLAERYELYVTAGSDYHGKNKLVTLGDTGFGPDADNLPRGLIRFLERTLREQ